jgi:hypothetical protein
MSCRLFLATLLWLSTVATFAEQPESSKTVQESGAFLNQAELEHWIDDATASASPRFGVITAINKDRGVFEITEKITSAVKEQRTVVIFGDQKHLQPVVKFVIATLRYRYSLDNSPVYSVDGKKIKDIEAVDRLQVGRAVVLSSDGKMVGPRYRNALDRDTLILIPPVVQPLYERELQEP